MRSAHDPLARIGTAPDVDRFTVAEIIADCTAAGLLDELRSTLALTPKTNGTETTRVVRDLVYELAGTNNRDLAVDVLIHATGLGELDCRTLRDYARRHGMTAEGFRKHVNAMRRRLGLAENETGHRDEN